MSKKDTRPKAIAVSTDTRLGWVLTWLFTKLGRHIQPHPDGYPDELLLFFATKETLQEYSRERELEAMNEMMRETFGEVRAKMQEAQAMQGEAHNVYSMDDFRKTAAKRNVEETKVGHPPSLGELSPDLATRLYSYNDDTGLITYVLPEGEQVNTTLAQLLTEYETLQ